MDVPAGVQVVLYSEHETLALAAIDLSEVIDNSVAILHGGREAWEAAGLPMEVTRHTASEVVSITCSGFRAAIWVAMKPRSLILKVGRKSACPD